MAPRSSTDLIPVDGTWVTQDQLLRIAAGHDGEFIMKRRGHSARQQDKQQELEMSEDQKKQLEKQRTIKVTDELEFAKRAWEQWKFVQWCIAVAFVGFMGIGFCSAWFLYLVTTISIAGMLVGAIGMIATGISGISWLHRGIINSDSIAKRLELAQKAYNLEMA